jgi:hypothetical protein
MALRENGYSDSTPKSALELEQIKVMRSFPAHGGDPLTHKKRAGGHPDRRIQATGKSAHAMTLPLAMIQVIRVKAGTFRAR